MEERIDEQIDETKKKERIIVSEAPLTNAEIQDITDNPDPNMEKTSSVEKFSAAYIDKHKDIFISSGKSEKEWELHQLLLILGNAYGLSIDEIDLYAAPYLNIQQKGTILFLLFAKIIDKDTIIKEIIEPSLSFKEMVKEKLPKLIDDIYFGTEKTLLKEHISVLNEFIEQEKKEVTHLEELYEKSEQECESAKKECVGLRGEVDRVKKIADELSIQVQELEEQLEEKDNRINNLQEESRDKDIKQEEIRAAEEEERKRKEEIEQQVQIRLAEERAAEEEERKKIEEIKRKAIEEYKLEQSSQTSTSIIQAQSVSSVSTEQKKERKGLFSWKKKKEPEKVVYGQDLKTCVMKADLDVAQSNMIHYGLENQVDENVLVDAINNNCTPEQMKALIDISLAKTMAENRQKEKEEQERHQQEVNDYGLYTQEEVRYGE